MRDPLREAHRWLAEGETDVQVTEALAERFPARACFHAQQAAEKGLKAILYGAGERQVTGHSLGDLGNGVQEHSPDYRKLQQEVAKLDRYYIPTRYPNGLPQGGLPSETSDAEDAAAAIATARKVLEHARRFLDERSA